MLNRKLNFSIVLMFVIGFTGLKAQSTITASGGNASGTGGNVTYTVGQIVYTTNTGTSGKVYQGVQQPYEITVVTGIDDALDISLEMLVYPNPTTDFIKLTIKNFEIESLSYQLYDINGSLLKIDKVVGNETHISMQGLKPSTYFIKVIQGNRDIKTFKIIKN
jgi:hypothetical protein